MKTIDIKGKPYIEVHERIKFFRDEYKGYSMTSEIIEHSNGSIIIRALITDENGKLVSSGIAREKEGDGFINKSSYVENCETSAWGRALGNLGIGIDASIASANEVQNAMRQQSKPELNEKHPKWDEVKKYISDGGDISSVRSKFIISVETEKLLID